MIGSDYEIHQADALFLWMPRNIDGCGSSRNQLICGSIEVTADGLSRKGGRNRLQESRL